MRWSPEIIARFEAKVDRDGPNLIGTPCWLWTGCLSSGKYGNLVTPEGQKKAHRISYEIYVREIPPGEGSHGTCVCHKCDNPRCVNPAHLFLGTHKDNMRDRELKKRGVMSYAGRAENNVTAKLKNAQVTNIRILRGLGANQYDIASWFNCSQSMISKMTSGNARPHG